MFDTFSASIFAAVFGCPFSELFGQLRLPLDLLFRIFDQKCAEDGSKTGLGDSAGHLLLATGVPLAPLWRLLAILDAFWSQFWLPFSSLLHPFCKNDWTFARFVPTLRKTSAPLQERVSFTFGYGFAHVGHIVLRAGSHLWGAP